MTPTHPYWPCFSLSLSFPQMPPLDSGSWLQLARSEATPRAPQSPGGGRASSCTPSTYCVCEGLPGPVTLYLLPRVFRQQPPKATILHSFHRAGSQSLARQRENSCPGSSDSHLCLPPPPHLLSAQALNRCAPTYPSLPPFTSAHAPARQAHTCAQTHIRQGGCADRRVCPCGARPDGRPRLRLISQVVSSKSLDLCEPPFSHPTRIVMRIK